MTHISLYIKRLRLFQQTLFIDYENISNLSLKSDELFISIRSYASLAPGKSMINERGDVTHWANGQTYTFVNYYFAKKYSPNDPNFGLSYLMAHELLHQLYQKAIFSILGYSEAHEWLKNDYGGHDNSVINLNMEGPLIYNSGNFPQSKSDTLRSSETILDYQRNLILLYLFENYLNRK